MKKNFTLAFFLILSQLSFSQFTFQKIIYAPGNQRAVAVIQASSHDYYILSEADSLGFGGKDFLVIKLDESGNQCWSKFYGTSSNDYPTDIRQLSNGDFVICGNTDGMGIGNMNILLLKIDSSGTVFWSKTYGGTGDDFGYKMVATSDSSIVVAGGTNSYGVAINSGYALRIDVSGGIVWSLTCSFDDDNCFKGVDKTAGGDFVFVGNSATGFSSPYIVVASSFGSVTASNTIPGSESVYPNDVIAVPGGDFFITGKVVTSISDTGSVFLLRANPAAISIAFIHDEHSAKYDVGMKGFITSDGQFAVVGFMEDTASSSAILLKIGLGGTTVLRRFYKLPSTKTHFYSATPTNDNGFLMVGNIQGYLDTLSHIYLVKSLVNGTSGCNQGTAPLASGIVHSGIAFSGNNNFGGVGNTISLSTASANLSVDNICIPLGIEEDFSNPDFAIFPNPANEYFTVTLNREFAKVVLSIYTILGEKLYMKILSGKQQTINCKGFSAGTYFVVVSNGEMQQSQKIIVK